MDAKTYFEMQAAHDARQTEFFDTAHFKNPDDIIGVSGFVSLQAEEIEAIKDKALEDDRAYLASHPELQKMLEIYTIKLLDQKPDDVLTFTGNFFSK